MLRPHARNSATAAFEGRIGRALLGGAVDGAFACAEDGQISFIDAAAAGLLGIRLAQARRSDLHTLLGTAPDETLELRFRSALTGGAAVEFVVERPGGADEWLEVQALPLDEGMAFLLKDVTQRERGERQLRRKEQRLLAANRSLRLAHKAARAASWEWRLGSTLRWLDLGAARDLIGLPPTWTEDDELPDWRSLVPSEDAPALEAGLQRLAATGEATFEFRVRGADGAHHWMQASAAVTERSREGAPILVSGVTVDVTAAKEAEQRLREEVAERALAEQHQKLLVGELNHRVKNMLATVQSLARQSLSSTEGAIASEDFQSRLVALAWAYDVLTTQNWTGADLGDVLRRTLAPHMTSGAAQIVLEGPVVWLNPGRAVAVAMAAHELATNALKYGALSRPEGSIQVSWRRDETGDEPGFRLTWMERGGPEVRPPARRGFGSRLVERSLARELGGRVALRFDPEGLTCEVWAPL